MNFNHVLAMLGILLLTLCFFLSGCENPQYRNYSISRSYERRYNEDDEERPITITPPALIVTPTPFVTAKPFVRPWSSNHRVHTDPIPVIPVEPGDHLSIAPQCVKDFDNTDAIFAYATIDKPYLSAE